MGNRLFTTLRGGGRVRVGTETVAHPSRRGLATAPQDHVGGLFHESLPDPATRAELSPLPWGEGWGEGMRFLVDTEGPAPSPDAVAPTSPNGRGARAGLFFATKPPGSRQRTTRSNVILKSRRKSAVRSRQGEGRGALFDSPPDPASRAERPPLPWGEGWGDGMRFLVDTEGPAPSPDAVAPTSPNGRGARAGLLSRNEAPGSRQETTHSNVILKSRRNTTLRSR